MATASVSNTFVASTPAEAAEVNTNFTNLVTFLNNSVVHRDGSKAMTAAFDGGGFKLTNVAAATAASDAPRLDQVALSDYVALGSNTAISSGGTLVATFSVTAPSAGMAFIHMVGNITASGITYNSGFVAVRPTVSGATLIYPTTTPYNLTGTTVTGDVAASNVIMLAGSSPICVSLAAGANTIALTLTRANIDAGGGTPTGGTYQLDSGFRFALTGMA